MFGFSLTKILFTVAVVIAVWYGFKWVGRVQAQRAAENRRRVRGAGRSAPPSAPPGGSEGGAEDMVACPACGDYVAPGSAITCGRAECPYPG